MKNKPDLLKDMLEDTQELHALGLVTDEELAAAVKRVKAREMRDRIEAVKQMTAEEIKEARTRWGMSQSLVAYSFGMTVDSISKWERGEIKPSKPALRMLQLLRDNGPELFASKH